MAQASRLTPKRVVLLTHESLLPPDSIRGLDDKKIAEVQTEWDVYSTLKRRGHDVVKVGLYDELVPLRRAIREHQPHVVFNLLEEFHEQVIYDAHVVGYLELLKQAYTGCNPRGLVIARDKALSKKILTFHRIKSPRFHVYPRHRGHKKIRLPKEMSYPAIAKSLVHEGSEGIAQASVVHDDAELTERVGFVHDKLLSDAIVEQYVEGRELYVSVLGNHRLQVFPTWEIVMEGMPEESYPIATRKVKWDEGYQKKHKIRWGKARNLDEKMERDVARAARRICQRLGVDGYCRIDFRLTEAGELFFLEANPNPDIASSGEFAASAKAGERAYADLLDRIVQLGIRRLEAG